jgi:PhoH-like ATPase
MPKSNKWPESFDKFDVLDSNILIDEPDSIIELINDNNMVGVPWKVHEELNRKKRDPLIGRNAQKALKIINEYLKYGNPYLQMINVNWKGIENYKPGGILNPEVADDVIIATALSVRKMSETRGKQVVLLTHDYGMQTKAREMKFSGDNGECLIVQEWNQDLGDTADQLKMPILDLPKELAKDKSLKGRIRADLIQGGKEIQENCGVQFRQIDDSGKSYISHAARKKGDSFFLLDQEQTLFGLKQRQIVKDGKFIDQNWDQIHAIHSLLDLGINYFTLIGDAGTGKTLLALASAFHYLVKSNRKFNRLYITRAPVSFGKTMGFLPGGIDEKMNPWVMGMIDNIERLKVLNPQMAKQIDFLVNGENLEAAKEHINKQKEKQSTGFKEKNDAESFSKKKSFISKDDNRNDKRKRVEILPFEHIRGRTLPDADIILDEGQNISREETITFATRLGEGSRLIITGDPTQIDNNFLSEQRNGLVWFAKLMKGDKFYSNTYIQHSVRSKPVQAFLKRLNKQ